MALPTVLVQHSHRCAENLVGNYESGMCEGVRP